MYIQYALYSNGKWQLSKNICISMYYSYHGSILHVCISNFTCFLILSHSNGQYSAGFQYDNSLTYGLTIGPANSFSLSISDSNSISLHDEIEQVNADFHLKSVCVHTCLLCVLTGG